MKRLVRFFGVAVLLSSSGPGWSASQRGLQAKVEHVGSPLLGKQASVAMNENQSALPSTGMNAAKLMIAGNAEFGGEATKSISTYQTAYDTALRGVTKTPIGSPQHLEFIQQAVEAGYYLGWARYDQRDTRAGDVIVARMAQLLAPFDRQDAAPEWRLSLARLYWLRSRLAQERHDKAEGERDSRRVLLLTTDRQAVAADYGPISKIRIAALWTQGDGPALDKSRQQACAIVTELNRLAPGAVTWNRITCANELARQDIAAKRYDAALGELRNARTLLAAAEKRNQATPAMKMIGVDTENEIARIAQNRHDDPAAQAAHLAAATQMIRALKAGAFSANTTSEVVDKYTEFSSEDFKSIPGYAAPAKSDALVVATFGGIGDAIEPSRKMFSKSRNFGLVAASADGLAANADIRLGKFSEGLVYARRAITSLEDAEIGLQGGDFTEDGQAICNAYGTQTSALMKLDRFDEAVKSYNALSARCGAWLRQYPFDFYARSPWLVVANNLGIALWKARRPQDARPILEYASKWGKRDASTALAELYRATLDGSEAKGKAAAATKLAEQQSMKRFTVPTVFSGEKYPFYVYIVQYGPGKRCLVDRPLKPENDDCVGFDGIDDQVRWVKDARGGDIPKDVIASFQNLDKIAREHDVSFPDLAVYALGEANKIDVGATETAAQAIHAEMLRTSFRRNPRRWLDGAGIALSGYDAVSYSEGTKPVAGKATIFALWDGAVWLFESGSHRDAFLADPERFAPQYGAFAATELANGGGVKASSPTIFRIVEKKLYLFDAEDDAKAWVEDFKTLSVKAGSAWATDYATDVDRDSDLAKLILKIAPVPQLSRVEAAGNACEKGDKMACLAVNESCSNNSFLDACDVRVSLAERSNSKDAMVSALGNRSWHLTLHNQPAKAIADADRALAIDPKQPWIAANRADAQLIQGDVSEAIRAYKALQDQPDTSGKGKMCPLIQEDIKAMLDKKLIAPEVAAKARHVLACQ